MNSARLYDVALTFLPGVGASTARRLVDFFGSAEAVFKASRKDLLTIEGIGEGRAATLLGELKSSLHLRRAETELAFAGKHRIEMHTAEDAAYPTRLRQCEDAPYLLYSRGTANLNAARIISVIGTRKPSDYGVQLCEQLIAGLATENVLVVSGLAQGVDAVAHRQSVASGVPTVGVLAHGLDMLYPPAHRGLAAEMIEKGGALLTEIPHGTKLNPNFFPVRNRIVAGMCDVTVIVESGIKGGSMITAYLAQGYNREIAAFPGRVGDNHAEGCNALIRRNVAALITNAADLLETMNWLRTAPKKTVQPKLMLTFSPEETKVVQALENQERVHVDQLLIATGLESSKLAATLLQLELQGIIRSLAGKAYRLA
jgi:DNA processing protein